MYMVTLKQNKLIWVLAGQLGMNSDMLHALVLAITGKVSIKDLSVEEGAKIIETLERTGGKIKRKKRPPKKLPHNVVELVTRPQIRLIHYLEKQLDWQENPHRLEGFIKRIIKKRRIYTKQEAIKVIQGLKSMVTRDTRKQANRS